MSNVTIPSPYFAKEIQAAKIAGKIPKSLPVTQKAWEAAKGFEASLFQTLLGSMFEGLKGEGMMGNESLGQDSWRSMLIEEYSKSSMATGGIGLSPQIYREMLRHAEHSST